MQIPGPAADVDQLGVGEQLGVDVDDPAGQVGQHLPAARVEAQHARNRAHTLGLHMAQQPVHRRRPGTGSPANRPADPHRATNVTAGQGLAVQQPVAERRQERPVRLQPGHRVELLGPQPADRIVLMRDRLPTLPAGQRDTQLVAGRDLLVPVQPAGDLDPAVDLLMDLAGGSRRRGLARSDLASRQLPAAPQGRWAASPRGQQSPVAQDRDADDGDHSRVSRAGRGPADATGRPACRRSPRPRRPPRRSRRPR